jgi:hypothetical protein
MSVKISAQVWEWSQANGTDRLVMLALADFCDDDGVCFPGVARVAKKCRISERSVQRAFRSLEAIGELTVEMGKGAHTDTGATNRFRLTFKGRQSVTPDVQAVTSEAPRGDNHGTQGVTTLSPKPSVEPSDNRQSAIPSMDDCRTEAANRGMPIEEGEKFFNYHDARGWMMGKVKMKKWRAAFATWHLNWMARDAKPPVAGKAPAGSLRGAALGKKYGIG